MNSIRKMCQQIILLLNTPVNKIERENWKYSNVILHINDVFTTETEFKFRLQSIKCEL